MSGVAVILALPRRALVYAVHAYRYFISPALGSNCRYTPSCSAYALEALQTHGAAAGSYLAARRVLRCHPACLGGDDPVPSMLPAWWPARCAGTARPDHVHPPSGRSSSGSDDPSSPSLNVLP